MSGTSTRRTPRRIGDRSTLPPLRMIPNPQPSTGRAPDRTGATGTAADGSMTILIRSQTNRMASRISRLGHRDDVVDQPPDHRERPPTQRGPQAVGDRLRIVRRLDRAGRGTTAASSAADGSTPTTRVDRGSPLDRRRGPGQQAAAADRGQDQVERPRLIEQFQGRGPLPGDHPPVVVRVDEGVAMLSIRSATVPSRAARVGSQGTTRAP